MSSGELLADVMLLLGLNPCFNGICSMRWHAAGEEVTDDEVLILVLMEYAQ